MSYPAELTVDLTHAKRSGANGSYRDKEIVRAYSAVAMADKNELKEVLTVQWYQGRSRSASQIYCNLWIRHGDFASGSGQAGGYGYDKQSAALDDAIESAGVKLSRSISGTGESRQACEAIVKAMGFTNFIVVEH